MTKQAEVRMHLTIEQDEAVPVSLVQVALDGDDVMVVATNFNGDARGAAAVALFLHTAAQAIDAELVRKGEQPSGAVNATPQRPRFNPRPAGGKP